METTKTPGSVAGSVCFQSCPERESSSLATSVAGTVEGSVCCQSYPDRAFFDADVALPNSLSDGGERPDVQEQWKAVSVASLTLIVLPVHQAQCWKGYTTPTLPAGCHKQWVQKGAAVVPATRRGDDVGAGLVG